MKVLFWNTHNNANINQYIRDLIITKGSTFVALAEYKDDILKLIEMLSESGIHMRLVPSIGCMRITIISSEPIIEPGIQSKYASFQIVNGNDILCCVHLQSKIYNDSDKQRQTTIRNIVYGICETEDKNNTSNTIVVGDFNMNPYDDGCLEADCFHGLPIYHEAKRKIRKIADENYKMFYNPMWNFCGDFSKPYGTYYHSGNNLSNTYWNIFDQVIIRPDLKQRFTNKSLEIITSVNGNSLLNTSGYPNKDISDHLPISFELKEKK